MKKDARILGIIPARGGSKGLPRKNIRILAGKPLIAWTIEAALASTVIDRVIVSSEDQEILQTARQWGADVPFVRPAELALDTTPGVAPVVHALETLPEEYDFVVLLQPTSPLRESGDIDAAVRLCREAGAPACVGVVEPDKSPYWMFTRAEDGRLSPLIPHETLPPRRQDLPVTYSVNGAVYVASVPWFLQKKTFFSPETIGYVMPRKRSLDIDDALDFAVADMILSGL